MSDAIENKTISAGRASAPSSLPPRPPAVTRTTKSKYALIPHSSPIELPFCDSTTAKSKRKTKEHHQGDDDVRDELLSIYEMYAALYPNPDLSLENQERDRLLRAVQAADHAVQLNPPKKKKKKSGWFGLFASRHEEESSAQKRDNRHDEDLEDDHRLKYTEPTVNNNKDPTLFASSSLLGTEDSLDTSHIPADAHAVARRHLLLHQHHPLPNLARTAWERAGTRGIALTDLGTVVEFSPSTAPQSPPQPAQQQHTSDRSLLLKYHAEQQQHQHQQTSSESSSLSYDIAQARAVLVGPNLLIVSWGLPNDDRVVFYRRLVVSSNNTTTATMTSEVPAVVWDAVACLGPTAEVQDSLCDVFLQDEGTTSSSATALLAVTDIVPLVVEIPDQAPCLSLAVARLGGSLELVPLPNRMWYGPELHPHPKRNRKIKRGEHYTAQLSNLANVGTANSGILALTTSEYHVDIMGLASFRTTVNDDVEWNSQLYPHGPPAEHVVVAHGRLGNSEALTFWSVSTVIAETGEFTLHASLVEALDLGPVGPGVTLFASPTLMRHWRRPRHVELRTTITPTSPEEGTPVVDSPTRARVTTLSVSAPIVNVQFLVNYNNNDSTPAPPTVRAALQDWNGGVTILDCDLLEKAVSQTLSQEEYDWVYNNSSSNHPDGDSGEHMVVPLVKIIQNRSSSIRQLGAGSSGKKRSLALATNPRLQSVQWFERKGPVSSNGSSMNYALAALTGGDLCSLRLVFPAAVNPHTLECATNEGKAPAACESVTVDCYNYSAGALHRFCRGRKNYLYLILLSSSAGEKRKLAIFCLQELGPKEIVDHLVESNQLREALLESQHVPASEYESISSSMEKCKKLLWEVERDFYALEAVKDDAYIVEQALNVPFKDARNDTTDDVGLFRAVCRLALNRMQTARLGASLVFAGSVEKARHVRQDLETSLVKIGTYELLCRYLSCKPSLNQFLEQYLPVTTIDLAMSFAKSADIIPLTLLFLRHRQDLWRHECRILDQIPLSVSPFLYQHLLPVTDEDCNAGIHTGLFMAGPTPELLLDITCLPNYVKEKFDFPAVIDEEDEKLTCELTAKLISDAKGDSGRSGETVALPDWFAQRADLIDTFLSSLDRAAYFSDLALCALRFERGAVASETLSPPLSKLYRLATFANTLRSIIPDPSDTKLLVSLTHLGSDRFATIAENDLAALVMNCGGETVDLRSRYDHILLPLLRASLCGVHDDSILYQKVDQALLSFCISLFDDASALLNAVNLCSRIIFASRTSLEQPSRLIKERNEMINLALTVFRKVAEATTTPFEMAGQLQLMDALWIIYESLPHVMPQSGCKEDHSALKGQIDFMFDHLVFLDLVVRWPSTGAFSLLQEKLSILSENDDRKSARHIRFGNKTVSILCQSFCSQLQDLHGQSQQRADANELLMALLNDVNQLNALCFERCLSLKETFADRLFRPLLFQHEIPLLGEFFARAPREDIDMESIAKEVSIFFDDAVYESRLQSDYGSSRLSAAMQCHDLLEKYLPEFRCEFRAVRMYLDVAYYISSTLLPDSDINFGPDELRDMLPLDVVDRVLAANPHALVIECTEWSDHVWAKQANEIIRNHIRNSTLAMESTNLPPLPGQSVLYLAKLLGMENRASVIAVKYRAIEFALLVGLMGVASALCRSLIADVAASGGDTSPALYSVAKIAAEAEYDDVETKKELLSLILVQRTENLTPARSKALEDILNAWNIIEHHERVVECPLRGPLVSTRLLFHDIQVEYSTDLQLLFTTLYDQMANCMVDDALLQPLARYTMFWCIGRTTRPKRNPVGPFEPPSTEAMIALAASLVLHIRNSEISEPCLGELRQIFHEQIVHVTNLSATCEQFARPDLSIVRKLMGRGYSEFGSRRAAVMTNNAGFDLALQWAVLHSTDHDFDAPLSCIRSPEERFIDKKGKDTLGACIGALQKILSGELPLSNIFVGDLLASRADFPGTKGIVLPAVQVENSTAKKDWDLFSPPASEMVDAGTAQPRPHCSEYDLEDSAIDTLHPEGDAMTTNNSPALVATDSKSTFDILVVPRSASLSVGTCKSQTAGGSGKLKVPAPRDEKASSYGKKLPANPAASNERRTAPATDAASPPPRSPSQVKMASVGNSDAPGTNGIYSPSSSEAPSAAATPTNMDAPTSRATRNIIPPRKPRLVVSTRSPPVGSPDRSSLLELGQAVFRSARHASPSRMEERRRLMEQGRLLLQKARSAGNRAPQAMLPQAAMPLTSTTPESLPAQTAEKAVPVTAEKSDDADQWDFEDDFDI